VRYYPVFLDLAGELAVVIGFNHLADEKAALLAEAGARVRRFAAHEYEDGVLAGARIVIDAGGDAEVNARAWAEAEAAGILINVLDRTHQCRFIAPAVVRRDPLLVAISYRGAEPFLGLHSAQAPGDLARQRVGAIHGSGRPHPPRPAPARRAAR